MALLICNIQRYAIHDGGGIRTTVFFKGCPLACSWCHNPETQSYEAKGTFREISPKDLALLLTRDCIFFGTNGGVTLSGGEPLSRDMVHITELLKILKRYNIHVAIDTCGAVPWENFAQVLPYTNVFLYDIKVADDELHIHHMGRSNQLILENLERLSALSDVWLRVPVIGGVNDGDEMQNIIEAVRKRTAGNKVTLLPYHSMGEVKRDGAYSRPGIGNFYTPASKQMESIADNWKLAGFDVVV